MLIRLGNVALLVTLGSGLAGCHTLHKAWHECPNQDKVLSQSHSIPPLKIPVGIDPPDNKSALQIPELNEPPPPPRGVNDPCLDEPPKYIDPTRGPRPPPAA